MSAAAAAAAPEAGDAPVKKKSFLSKKLLIIALAAFVLLAGAGGGALYLLKKRAAAAAAAAEEADGETAQVTQADHAAPKRDPKDVPTFLPLDPFTVNLSDKDQERYAQIGITLEVDDAKFAEQMKAYMPAIRNGVLMILAHKSSTELLERAGKEQLAAEIMREAVRPLGIEIEAPQPAAAAASNAAKPKKKSVEAVHNPVRHVHFSNFIIQ